MTEMTPDMSANMYTTQANTKKPVIASRPALQRQS